MSAPLSRRARLSDAIAAEIDARSIREIGEAVGRSKTAVHLAGSDLTRWTAADLLAMAEAFPAIRTAALDAFGAEAPRAGDGRRSLEDVTRVLPGLLAEAQRMAAAAADRQISRDEAREIAGHIPGLLRDLAALQADLLDRLHEGRP